MNRLLSLAFAIMTLGLVSVSLADAQLVSDSALSRCARISTTTNRLRCYDGLVRNAGLTTSQSSPPATRGARYGKWIVKQQTNPLDDSKTVALLLDAAEGRSGMLRQAPMLAVRCQSGEVEIYIDWRNYMGSDASTVTTRLGTADPETQEWSHSTDNQATFYPGDHVTFLQSLLDVDRLVAKATPYSESPVTAVFLLAGLDQAVVPLRAACGTK